MPRSSASRPPRPSPLQNRVDVYGQLVRTAARGKVMGNRGILHDKDYNIVRPWKLKMWISCVLNVDRTREVQLDDNRAFNGRKRELMSLWHYTELFYLDEVTALATGARPCGCCRRTDYDSFKEAWRQSRGLGSKPLNSAMMDDELHASRLASAGLTALVEFNWAENERSLPSGVMVEFLPELSNKQNFSGAYLIWDGYLRKWSWQGYGPPLQPPSSGVSLVLTPTCIVDCLRAGYRPVHCPFVAGIDEEVRPWQDPPNGRADTPPDHVPADSKRGMKGFGRGLGHLHGRGCGYTRTAPPNAVVYGAHGSETDIVKADKWHPSRADEESTQLLEKLSQADREDVPQTVGLDGAIVGAAPVIRRWRKKRIHDGDA